MELSLSVSLPPSLRKEQDWLTRCPVPVWPWHGGWHVAGVEPGSALCPGKTVVHQLSVSLEDLYNGSTRKLSLQKNIICRKCGGE